MMSQRSTDENLLRREARRPSLAVLMEVVLLIGCGAEASTDDASVRRDSGARADSGSRMDSGARADSGSHMDSGARADSGAAPDATTPGWDAGPSDFTPHPRMSAIMPGEAHDLLAYSCNDRVDQYLCASIHDYSGFSYDPYGHRILFFGGGHSATARTDIDTLELDPSSPHSLEWRSLYPSMTCAQTSYGDGSAPDIDPGGFHRSTGHPTSRHTYDLNVVAMTEAGPRFVMLSYEGFAGECHRYDHVANAIPSYPLYGASPEWSYHTVESRGWYYAAQAEFDPVSGMIIAIDQAGLSVYDPNPSTEGIVAQVEGVRINGYDGNLVFYPPTGDMYYISRTLREGDPVEVHRVVLNREDWSRSTATRVEVSGTPPVFRGGFATGYAYDPEHQRIGGGILDGVFYRFDPRTNAWSAQSITSVSDGGRTVDRVIFHTLVYDPVNRVFLFEAGGPRQERLWAYRDTP